MSELGLGRVKTPTFNLRVEIPSRFRKFENQKCLRPPLREDDRENNSAHSWLVHVFTQPGSKRRRTHYEQMFSAVHPITDIEARLCGLVYKPETIDATPDTWRRVFRGRAETPFCAS